MNQEFITALAEIAEDKNISKESLLETIEFALITAYKKNYDHRSDKGFGKVEFVFVSVHFDLRDNHNLLENLKMKKKEKTFL